MSRLRFRQLARLEKLAQPFLRRRTESNSQIKEFLRREALTHVANLSALILYGAPKIDEPLSVAWRRCLQSDAWAARREKHGGWDEYGRDNCGNPFVNFGAMRIAQYFRNYFIPDFSGSDEIDKFSVIFEAAPPWLLWFTYGDVSARILGIRLPDLSSVSRFIRGEFKLSELPVGPFDCHPLPDGAVDRFAVLRSKKKVEDEMKDLSPRERMRTLQIYARYESGASERPISDLRSLGSDSDLKNCCGNPPGRGLA